MWVNLRAGAIGFSLAINEIGVHDGHSVTATIDNSDVSADGDLIVSATSEASIESLSIGAAGSGAGSGADSGLTVALAGAGGGQLQHDQAVDRSHGDRFQPGRHQRR